MDDVFWVDTIKTLKLVHKALFEDPESETYHAGMAVLSALTHQIRWPQAFMNPKCKPEYHYLVERYGNL